jgi:hyperosmotically inducible protein
VQIRPLAVSVHLYPGMRYSRAVHFLTLVAVAGGLTVFAAGQQPDNTKVNKNETPTADQAKNNAPDRDVMQKIRQAVMDDKSLSTYAHNVKIIAKSGKVTLKGPVRSEEEKKSVAAKAEEVAGAGNVINELTVKPDKANRQKQTPQ